MTLQELISARIPRFRRPQWANVLSYAKLDLFEDGTHGPWLQLFDRPCQDVIGEPTPQHILIERDSTDDYEEYKGSLDRDDK